MDNLPPEFDDDDYEDDMSSCSSKKRKVSKEVSDEIKQLVIRALKTGICSKQSAATTFNLPYSKVVSIYNDSINPAKFSKPIKNEASLVQTKLEDDHVQFFLDSLADNCKYTLKDLRELTKNKYGVEVNTSKIASCIPPFHFSFKRAEDVALTTITPEIMADHKEYCELFLQLKDSERLLIYFDETEFEVTMRRFSGKQCQAVAATSSKKSEIALKNKPTMVPPPSIRIRHKTIMAAMIESELIYYKAYDGSRKDNRLLEFLNGLFSELSTRRVFGAVLIMGNTAFNQCHEITKVTQLAGHEVVFLPACSSFLNPIENMFSQWTRIIRSKDPTTERELETLIGSFESVISVEQCKYFYNHVIDNVTCCVTGRLVYSDE